MILRGKIPSYTDLERFIFLQEDMDGYGYCIHCYSTSDSGAGSGVPIAAALIELTDGSAINSEDYVW